VVYGVCLLQNRFFSLGKITLKRDPFIAVLSLTMRIHLYALLLLGTLCSLRAVPAIQDATAAGDDSLPPVPFIIGGDDVVSPAQSGQSGPLVLPEGGKSATAATASSNTTDQAVPDTAAKPAIVSDKAAVKSAGDDLVLEDSTSDLPSSSNAETSAKLAEAASQNTTAAIPPTVATPVAPTPVANKPVTVVQNNTPATDQNHASTALSADDLDGPMPLLLPPSSEEVSKKSVSIPATTSQTVAAANIPVATRVTATSEPVVAVPPPTLPSEPVVTAPATPAVTAPVVTRIETPIPEVPNTSGMTIVPVAAAPTSVQAPVTQTVALPAVPTPPAPPKTPTTVGADGVSQVKGVEHFVGRNNQILPPVQMSSAVAVVGEEMPELHVSQIPLEDLLAYLKDYTPLRFSYQLSGPMYVSMDLKAHSVDDVMNYLMSHYPVDISTDGNTIFVRPAVAKVVGQATLPFQSRAASRTTLPVRAADGSMTVMPAAPAGSYLYRCPPTCVPQSASTVEDSWNQVRVKARLAELEKERMKLVAEHEKIQEQIHSCNMSGDEDNPSILSELPDLVTH